MFIDPALIEKLNSTVNKMTERINQAENYLKSIGAYFEVQSALYCGYRLGYGRVNSEYHFYVVDDNHNDERILWQHCVRESKCCSFLGLEEILKKLRDKIKSLDFLTSQIEEMIEKTEFLVL